MIRRTWSRLALLRYASLGCAGLGCASLLAGCGTQPSKVAVTTAPAVVTAPLSTSLVTTQGTWAIAVMGGSATSENNFWQLFVRPADASTWSLVTPAGVADNGGLVATGTPSSLLVGFRPSQDLAFSPLAASTNTGRNWTTGLLDADLANVPDAIAATPSGIEFINDADAFALGEWINGDRKSTRLNSSHSAKSRMPSSA